MYKHIESKQALKDWGKIKSMSPAVKKKFKELLLDILNNPQDLNAIGKPEQLKGMPNFYSRQLSKKDRIVYSVDDSTYTVTIYQYLGHYADK